MALQARQDLLAGVPALALSDGEAAEAARRGCLLVFHGLTARKEVQEPELARVARAGFVPDPE